MKTFLAILFIVFCVAQFFVDMITLNKVNSIDLRLQGKKEINIDSILLFKTKQQ